MLCATQTTGTFEGATVVGVTPPVTVKTTLWLSTILNVRKVWIEQHNRWDVMSKSDEDSTIACLKAVFVHVPNDLLDRTIFGEKVLDLLKVQTGDWMQ